MAGTARRTAVRDAVQAAADAHVPALSGLLLAAVGAARDSLHNEALERACEARDWGTVARLTDAALEALVAVVAPADTKAPKRTSSAEAGLSAAMASGARAVPLCVPRTAEERAWAADVKRRNAALAKKHPDVKRLFTTLKQTGGDGVILFDVAREPDLRLLAQRGAAVPTRGKVVRLMEASQCHTNVSRLYARGDVDEIVTGYALVGKDGMWRQHTWGLIDGKIRETTYEGYVAYYGVRLTPREAKAFARAQGVRL